jgi:hypothetical protein
MNRHGTDGVSLAFGLVFATFVGWWLLLRLVTVAAPGAGWVVAAALLVFGALGVVTTLASWRNRKAADPDPR